MTVQPWREYLHHLCGPGIGKYVYIWDPKLKLKRIRRCGLVGGIWSNMLEEVRPCWRRVSLGVGRPSLFLSVFNLLIKCELSTTSLLGDFCWLIAVTVCHSLAAFFLSLAICTLPPSPAKLPVLYPAFSGGCPWPGDIWKTSLNQTDIFSLNPDLDPC